MLDGFVRDLGRLTVFVICAQLILYFQPRECYEKYLKLLVHLIILLQFLGPVKALLTGGELPWKWEDFGFSVGESVLGEEDLALEEERLSDEEIDIRDTSNVQIDPIEIDEVEAGEIDLGENHRLQWAPEGAEKGGEEFEP